MDNWGYYVQPPKPRLNAFYVMLTIISAIPTLFFGFVWMQPHHSIISAALTLWSGAWTYVWWSMRYR